MKISAIENRELTIFIEIEKRFSSATCGTNRKIFHAAQGVGLNEMGNFSEKKL